MVYKEIKFSPVFICITLLAMAFSAVMFFPVRTDAEHTNDDEPPYVETNDATNINTASATLNGFANGQGLSTRVWFEYGLDRDMDNTTSRKSLGSGASDFSAPILKLKTNAVYYFRAVARNNEGTAYGNTLSFRTSPYYQPSNVNYGGVTQVLTAITEPATQISEYSAQLNSLTLTSMNSPANVWFEWGTTAGLGNRTVAMPIGTYPSIRHVHGLTGLSPGVTYYFRAVAEDSSWRNNGSILSFMTARIPQVINIPKTPAVIEKTVEPEPEEDIKEKEEDKKEDPTPSASLLPANVVEVGFLPQTLLEWIFLIVLIFILILSGKHAFRKSKQKN